MIKMKEKVKIDWKAYHKFIDNHMRYLKQKNNYFRKRFGIGEIFKINARKYLKNIGLI